MFRHLTSFAVKTAFKPFQHVARMTTNHSLFPAISKPAPDFKGQAVINGHFKDIQLTDYQGKYVVLFFYPLDFTFVCPTEIIAFNERLDDFHQLNTQVIGCSTDSVHSHLGKINKKYCFKILFWNIYSLD
jgi:alkyl hydroperoxide reductase subunit AhpC